MRYQVSDHAIVRYQERVKPALTREQAKRELEALVGTAQGLGKEQSPWLTLSGAPVDAFLELSDGIIALVMDLTVITVLIRGGSHESVRKARNERKARRRRARRKSKDIRFASGGSEPRVKWR